MKWQNKRAANEYAGLPASLASNPGVDGVVSTKERPVLGDFLPALERRGWLFGLFLVAFTFIAYQPAWHGGAIWDDDKHMTMTELRSLNGLGRIWTQPGATPQYYPLVHSVFWVEHKLWGDATLGYHLLNILLHVTSALLLVKILQQLRIPGAWLAAALFALHPVEVESVAWISELKNTLSGAFYMGAALAYLGFDRNRSRGNYVAALVLFLLGLMSKTVIASLPAALLVMFWWQRGKLSWKKDVLPLMPFFITGIASGLFTAWVERRSVGAEGLEFHFSIIERILIAGHAVWFYLGKLAWPLNLAFIYPRWNVSQADGWQYLFPAATLLLFGVLIWWRWRAALAALLFFVGTLFPALGFFNVYPFRYSFVADHFQYLASIGPLTLAAAGITAATGFLRNKRTFLQPMACAALLLVLAALTWKQCGAYASLETLWQTTLRLNPDSWMVNNNLGVVILQKGQPREAIADFQKALQIKPDYVEARMNLGDSFFQLGRVDEAISQYRKVLQIQPDFADAHNQLGNSFSRLGRPDEAIAQYRQALQIKPDSADAHYNLGNALGHQGKADEATAQFQLAVQFRPDYAEAHYNLGNNLSRLGRLDEAISQFRQTLQIKPGFADAHFNLGNSFAQLGRMDEAISQYQETLQIKPEYAGAHGNLGMALMQKGKAGEAIAQFQKSLQLEPDDPEVQNDLAWLLATCPEASLRNAAKAVQLAQRANELTGGRNPAMLRTLAAAFAEAGRFGDAVLTAQKAIELAQAGKQPGLAAPLNDELKRYQAGLPLRQ